MLIKENYNVDLIEYELRIFYYLQYLIFKIILACFVLQSYKYLINYLLILKIFQFKK